MSLTANKDKSKLYLNFLKNISLFTSFTDEALTNLQQNISIINLAKNSFLFLNGDDADYLHIIFSGWIKLYRQTRNGHESIISILSNNDIFGKAAILENGFHTYNAQTLTEAIIIKIPAKFILYMASHHEEYENFLSKYLESEFQTLMQLGLHAEHLEYMSSADRVGCFLLRLSTGKEEENINIPLPFEKLLVAGKLGMTPETFSRSLNLIKNFGVETQNSIVNIKCLKKLKANICNKCSATLKECVFADDNLS